MMHCLSELLWSFFRPWKYLHQFVRLARHTDSGQPALSFLVSPIFLKQASCLAFHALDFFAVMAGSLLGAGGDSIHIHPISVIHLPAKSSPLISTLNPKPHSVLLHLGFMQFNQACIRQHSPLKTVLTLRAWTRLGIHKLNANLHDRKA